MLRGEVVVVVVVAGVLELLVLEESGFGESTFGGIMEVVGSCSVLVAVVGEPDSSEVIPIATPSSSSSSSSSP